jgi:syntaxin-binding protein 1
VNTDICLPAIELVDQKRESLSMVEAIYILEPCKYSVSCLLTDYTVIPSRYRSSHVFFLPGLTSELSGLMKKNHTFQKSLLTLKEFHLKIHPKESNVFITKNPQGLQIYYNTECHDLVPKTVVSTASSLLNICILTGEYPIIRYYSPNEHDGYFNASVLPKMIAIEFQNQLDNYAREHSDFPPESTRQRSVFVISDRTSDLFAPLLHEFTYQAMAYDLKDIKGEVYKYEAENERGIKEPKESKLNDEDPDWVKLRHLHILEAKELSSSKLEEFLSKNQMLVDRSNIKSTSDILTAVARLKGFDEERRRIVLHKTLIEDLLLLNGEKRLVELAEFEQDLANFGVDINGERVKNLAGQLISLLSSDLYSTEDKLRLIILYGLYSGGLIEDDYKKLFNFIGVDFEDSLNYIRNFEVIGFKLIKPNLKSKSSFKREFLHESISENSFNTSRFRPSINSIIGQIVSNTLSDELFPYTKDKPIDMDSDITRTNSTSTTSLKNPKHRPVWAKNNSLYKMPRQRIFYFIAGGMTYSESRTAYELSNIFDKEVFIGSDEILTPTSFLDQVKKLEESRNELYLEQDLKASKSKEVPRCLLETPKPRLSLAELQEQEQQKQKLLQQQQQQGQGQFGSISRADTLQTEAEKQTKRSRFKKFLKG